MRRAFALTFVVLLVELTGGLLSHSLALLSDAGHVLTDVFALGLAWFAFEQSQRPADRKRSYGYQRATILAALLNSITLIVIVVAIAYEALRRLAAPEPVQGGIVIVTALIGIAVNSFVIFGLRGGTKSLNIRAAFLHVAGDIGASIGVVVAGAVILFTGWLYIDPILSLGIAALIAFGAWGIVRETVNLLMEGTPRDIDIAAVTKEIGSTDHVTSMHDLHVWALSSDESALSVHVVVGECPLSDAEHVVRDLEQRLCSKFDIGHTTIQVESCHPCGEIEHGTGTHDHPGTCHCFMAWRIDAFTDLETYRAQMDDMMDTLRATPPAPGHDAVLAPGQPEFDGYRDRSVNGVPLHDSVRDDIRALAEEYDVPFDLD